MVVSPHCDDAAFSVGGLIKKYSQAGVKFTILTYFSRSKYTMSGAGTGIEEVSSLRKKEDYDFYRLCNNENIELLYLDLPEAPLRKDRGPKNIFGNRLTDEKNILAQKPSLKGNATASTTPE